MVGGVAGGMAQYFNIDPAWVRIAWLALLIAGVGFFLYIIAWIAIPEAQSGTEPAPRPRSTSESGRFIFGGILVLAGAAILARQYMPWMEDLFLPAVLIAVGAGVIIYSVKK